MSSSDVHETYVFCEKCRENIQLRISEADLTSRRGGLVALLSVHGSPQHALVAYLDKQLRVRGIEYPSSVHIRADLTQEQPAVIPQIPTELTLPSLIDLFGPRKKDALSTFARVLAQLLFRQTVLLIHDDPTISGTLYSTISGLFGGQSISLYVKDHASSEKLVGESNCVYDVQAMRFISVKTDFSSRFLEPLTKDIIDEPDGLFRLRNELSRLFYSYRRLKQILSSTTGKLLDTRLARDIAIDFAMLPMLFSMAESEGLAIKDRIEKDALGAALRSI